MALKGKPFWVYVNGAAKRNHEKENQAVADAKSRVKDNNEVVVMHITGFDAEKRLHVWINGVQTVKNGKVTGK